MCDWHIPYEDPKALAVAFKYAHKIQPDIIILHELHDFYSLSDFDKNPTRIKSLQTELDQVSAYLDKLRQLCPKSRIILLNSNHLDRLRKYLWRKAPALVGLRSLEIPTLLELSKRKIEFKQFFQYRGFLFKHGDVIRKFSGYSAQRGKFEKENTFWSFWDIPTD